MMMLIRVRVEMIIYRKHTEYSFFRNALALLFFVSNFFFFLIRTSIQSHGRRIRFSFLYSRSSSSSPSSSWRWEVLVKVSLLLLVFIICLSSSLDVIIHILFYVISLEPIESLNNILAKKETKWRSSFGLGYYKNRLSAYLMSV